MTHFEYIAVAISIILGLGIIQTLSSLDQVLAQSRRYWLHSLWVFFLFWIVIQNWWGLWDLRDVVWNLGYFSLLITHASILYLTITALTKTDNSDASLETVYYQRTRWIFGLLCLVAVSGVLSMWIIIDAPLLHPYRLVQYSTIAILAVLFTSKRKRLHEVLSVLLILIVFVGQILYRVQPGLFGNSG